MCNHCNKYGRHGTQKENLRQKFFNLYSSKEAALLGVWNAINYRYEKG